MKHFRIRVENKFKQGERGILVYNSADKNDTFIPWPEWGCEGREEPNWKVFDIPNDKDFLLITVTPRPNELEKPCKVELPSEANLRFLPIEEKETLIDPSNGGRAAMIIDEGPHTWQLKITRPRECSGTRNPEDNVTVGDDG